MLSVIPSLSDCAYAARLIKTILALILDQVTNSRPNFLSISAIPLSTMKVLLLRQLERDSINEYDVCISCISTECGYQTALIFGNFEDIRVQTVCVLNTCF